VPIVSSEIIESRGQRVSPSSRYWVYNKELYTQERYIGWRWTTLTCQELYGGLSKEETNQLVNSYYYVQVINERKIELILNRYKENNSYYYIIEKRYYRAGVADRREYFAGMDFLTNRINIRWIATKNGAFEMTQEVGMRTKRMLRVDDNGSSMGSLYLIKGSKVREEPQEPEQKINRFELIDFD
jgi:hypothetical protein